MEQVTFDIEQLKVKLQQQFGIVKYNTQDTTKLVQQRDETVISQLAASISNYLSQVHGRLRCQQMHKLTRDQLLLAKKTHDTNQSKCYTDLQTTLKNRGVI